MVCPFCKEEIKDEAIKCRYCGSSLLPPQEHASGPASPSTNGNQVTYVLDQGLIRFGKFVAGALAIFIAIGVYLYGIDVKESLKLIDASKAEVKQTSDAVKQSSEDVKRSSDDVKKSSDDISKVRSDVQRDEEQVSRDQDQTTDMIKASNAKLGMIDKQVAEMTERQQQTSAAAAKVQEIEANIQKESTQLAEQQRQAEALLSQAKSQAEDISVLRDKAAAGYLAITGGQAPTAVAAGSSPSAPTPASAGASPNAGKADAGTTVSTRAYTPVELAKLYNFPPNLTGKGQTVALIELGGGYRDAQLADYFKRLGVARPKVSSISIDGAKNSPSTPESADGEVQSDIEIAGAIAPGANIVVYFAPNSDQGFLDAIRTAINNDAPRTTVLSISWGGPESTWTSNALKSINDALQSAEQRKVTVLVAAGDSGATDGVKDGKKHVDFMASSPWVTAVGGTKIVSGGIVSGSRDAMEIPWDELTTNMGASGYGVSRVFPVPDWQMSAGTPATDEGFRGRALPDVTADASTSSGYEVMVDGTASQIGGTALATPLWAGLVALLNEGLGENVGFLNPRLYKELGPGMDLRPVPSRAAGERSGPVRWSPRTGWGSPDGQKLLTALRKPAS